MCDDPVPNPPRVSHLHYPLCPLRFPLKQMTVEHAPQRSGQSRLGPVAVAVLTCQRCNNTSGAGFESDAAALLADGEPEELTQEELAELARWRAEVSGSWASA